MIDCREFSFLIFVNKMEELEGNLIKRDEKWKTYRNQFFIKKAKRY